MDGFFFKLKIMSSFWDVLTRREFVLGRTVEEFEARLTDFTGARYVLGVNSGTDALILSLKACGVGVGDEVIVPAIGFSSTAAAVCLIGATPVFIDVNEDDYILDAVKMEAAVTSRTKAAIPVYLNGVIGPIKKIEQIARERHLFVIADAAHAIGSRVDGKPLGQFADLTCLSFNYTKLFGCYGDGGAVLTNNAELAEKIKLMRLYGSRSWKEVHSDTVMIGTASRLSPFQAAVLNVKFPHLEKDIQRQRENYFFYQRLFQDMIKIRIPTYGADQLINGFRFALCTPRRDELMKFLAQKGVRLTPYYQTPLPYLSAFRFLGYQSGDFPVAEDIARKVLVLPTHHSIPKLKIEMMGKIVRDFQMTLGE